MSPIDVNITETAISVILQVGALFIGILLILGYVFHIGRIVGNKLKFRETLPYEFKPYLATTGGLYILYLLVLFILPFILILSESPKIDTFSSDYIPLIAGIAVWLLFAKWVIKLNLLIGALSFGGVILLFALLYSIEPLFLYLVVPLISLYRLFGIGKKVGEDEFTKDANLVDVITDYGKEEKLILYQTTNADYRFRRKDGGEIIIPRERIVKIVHKK